MSSDNFLTFKAAIDQQLQLMAQGELYTVDAPKDEIWDLYLKSFPVGTNPVFRERTEHDGQYDKSFIRRMGRVVAIIDDEMVSIWDITIADEEAAAIYQPVADALSEFVQYSSITGPFRTTEPAFGHKPNVDSQNSDIIWTHFFYEVDSKFKSTSSNSPEQMIRKAVADKQVLESSVKTISASAIETVLDLIEDKVLYRGEEHKRTVESLMETKVEYREASNKDLFLWQKSTELKRHGRYKNTVIGTLLTDLSEGMDIEAAVGRFDSKMAGYKRTSAIVTRGMIDKAQKTIEDLGLAMALARRYAQKSDITANNVLYVDRSVKIAGNIFDELRAALPDNRKQPAQDILIEDFIELMGKQHMGSMEVMLKNHNNLMSLIAPQDSDAPNILKWNNNFSWTYNGDITDSLMKERVKAHGGKVDGKLRFSIMWNDEVANRNDMDAHCREPNGNHIFYSNKRSPRGELDVDIIDPNGPAVENIIFGDRMLDGQYDFWINTYSNRGGEDVSAEIEFDGKIHSFHFRGRTPTNIKVASVVLKDGQWKIVKHLEGSEQTKDMWGVTTNVWTPVDMVMMSPNFWDGQSIGNKHVFFILEGCQNPEKARGLYNEFLSDELRDHRKVFDHLGSRLKAPESDNQLSGVGFSSTLSNSLLCKTEKSGTFNIIFGENHV